MPAPKIKKLTLKQKKFCEEYVTNGGNGSAAVRTAGYDVHHEDSAANIALEYLRKAHIREYIAKLRKKIEVEFEVTAEEVITGLREVRKRALQEEEVFDRFGNPTGEYKCDLMNANRSLELLGKTAGLFVDKKELTGANGSPLQVVIYLPEKDD